MWVEMFVFERIYKRRKYKKVVVVELIRAYPQPFFEAIKTIWMPVDADAKRVLEVLRL